MRRTHSSFAIATVEAMIPTPTLPSLKIKSEKIFRDAKVNVKDSTLAKTSADRRLAGWAENSCVAGNHKHCSLVLLCNLQHYWQSDCSEKVAPSGNSGVAGINRFMKAPPIHCREVGVRAATVAVNASYISPPSSEQGIKSTHRITSCRGGGAGRRR